MTYDPEEHHRRSIRLKDCDYSQAGAYFITICTKNKKCIFGDVMDGVMLLNNLGDIVMQCWNDISNHFSNIELDAFIVMPNHIHGIILIYQEGKGTACRALTTERFGKPVPNSIPTIIRSFKSAVTKRINETHNTSGASVWHRNYHEHIIRNEESLTQIRNYIIYNASKWDSDEENPANKSHNFP